MSGSNYVGDVALGDILGDSPRFFYGLRRTDDGTLYFEKVDQLTSASTMTLNVPGPNSQNFENFEYGVDFFEGRLAVDHSRPYPNLYFDQYRWDSKNCYYYINTNGELVVRINQGYTYSLAQIVSA
jgi:hypothetical protein